MPANKNFVPKLNPIVYKFNSKHRLSFLVRSLTKQINLLWYFLFSNNVVTTLKSQCGDHLNIPPLFNYGKDFLALILYSLKCNHYLICGCLTFVCLLCTTFSSGVILDVQLYTMSIEWWSSLNCYCTDFWK